VTHIKNQAVFCGIKYGLNGNCQLNNAQIGRQMSTRLGHLCNKKFPDLPAQAHPFFLSKFEQVIMTVNIL
jgi:hypothetical protein